MAHLPSEASQNPSLHGSERPSVERQEPQAHLEHNILHRIVNRNTGDARRLLVLLLFAPGASRLDLAQVLVGDPNAFTVFVCQRLLHDSD